MSAAAQLRREESGLAVLTLDSPPLNLFDQRMIDDVRAAVGDVAAEPPRALLIRAEGRAVSGGVDVNVFDGLTPEQGSALWDELLGMIDQLERLPAPIVFAAHALTLTAAFEIALACDLIVASPKASFGLVEKVVGLLRRWAAPSALPSAPAAAAPASSSSPARSSAPRSWSAGASSTRSSRPRSSTSARVPSPPSWPPARPRPMR
jgi:enoyl-CoA hydratase/carnithine racemase